MQRKRADIIAEEIEGMIFDGTIGNGERLDEVQLAARFGVCRTPIREACQQLALSGLVEQLPRRGAFVRQPGPVELIQMFEVMAGLEGMAGRLAARRAEPEALERLTDCLVACEAAAAAGDPDAYYAENSQFHAIIYAAGGNDYLTAEATRLHQRLMTYRRLQLRVPRRMGQSLAEHRAIVEAITAGDAATAETALRDHVTIQGERFADFVAILRTKDAAE